MKGFNIPQLEDNALCELEANARGHFIGDEWCSCMGRLCKFVRFTWCKDFKDIDAWVNDGKHAINLGGLKQTYTTIDTKEPFGWIKITDRNREHIYNLLSVS